MENLRFVTCHEPDSEWCNKKHPHGHLRDQHQEDHIFLPDLLSKSIARSEITRYIDYRIGRKNRKVFGASTKRQDELEARLHAEIEASDLPENPPE